MANQRETMAVKILKHPIFAGLIVSIATIAILIHRAQPHRTSLGQDNAVWAQSLYLRGYQPTTQESLTQKHRDNFKRILRENKIRYAYLFAGPYEADGHLPPYAFSPTAIETVRDIQHDCPETILLPWVGGVVNKTVFLDKAQWVSNAIQDTVNLQRTLNVPGVHINFEFFTHRISDEFFAGLGGIEHYGDDEIHFLEQLRSALPHAFLSTVVVSTAPKTKHWKRTNTPAEIFRMAKIVDQIAILCYDTSLKKQADFRDSLQDQLRDIRQWKAITPRTQFLIAIGTFINKQELWQFRDLEIESIPNTLTTLKDLLPPSSKTEPILVDGLAIFAEWTTDENEWQLLRQHWFSSEYP